MASEIFALFAAIAFALFAIYGWLGLHYSTPLTATTPLFSLLISLMFFRGK